MMYLWLKFKSWIIGAGAVIAAVLAVYLKGRKDGKDDLEQHYREEAQEDVNLRKEINNSVRSASDDEFADRVSKWTRS